MPIDPNTFIRVPSTFAVNSDLFDVFRLGPGALRFVLTAALALCAAHLLLSVVVRVAQGRR